MKLVTNRRISANIDPDTKEANATVTAEANVVVDAEADTIVQLRNAGADSVRNARVFALEVDDDGVPTLGNELTG